MFEYFPNDPHPTRYTFIRDTLRLGSCHHLKGDNNMLGDSLVSKQRVFCFHSSEVEVFGIKKASSYYFVLKEVTVSRNNRCLHFVNLWLHPLFILTLPTLHFVIFQNHVIVVSTQIRKFLRVRYVCMYVFISPS